MLRILLVDRNESEIALLDSALRDRGYDAVVWEDGPSEADSPGAFSADGVVLDLEEPLAATEQRIGTLKLVTPSPILGLGTVAIMEAMLETKSFLAVDDVIVRPFQVEELDARLRLLVARRRWLADKAQLYPFVERRQTRVGDGGKPIAPRFGVAIDHRYKCALIGGRAVALSPKEYELLSLLYERQGGTIAVVEIMDRLWPKAQRGSEIQVQQYIYRLRRKLETDPARPRLIVNVKGFGYRLCEPEEPEEEERAASAPDDQTAVQIARS